MDSQASVPPATVGIGPDAAAAAVDVDRIDLELARVEESLRLLDDADVEPSAAVAWLTSCD